MGAMPYRRVCLWPFELHAWEKITNIKELTVDLSEAEGERESKCSSGAVTCLSLEYGLKDTGISCSLAGYAKFWVKSCVTVATVVHILSSASQVAVMRICTL